MMLYCDASARVLEFIKGLTTAGAWPLSIQRNDSATHFLSKLKMVLPQPHHSCEGDLACPLILSSQLLKGQLDDMLVLDSKIPFRPARFDSAL